MPESPWAAMDEIAEEDKHHDIHTEKDDEEEGHEWVYVVYMNSQKRYFRDSVYMKVYEMYKFLV